MKEIAVGSYVHLDTWKPGDKLWSDWIENDPEYSKEIVDLNLDEEILPAGEYTLVIDYPLSNPYRETFITKFPIQRKEIVELIVNAYHRIYNEENDTSNIKPALISGMYNRIHTNGNYGIWGHDLGDLVLHTIYVDENNIITLGISS